MTRARQTTLAILLAALLATTMLATTVLAAVGPGTALARPASHSLNLHHVRWGNVTIPGRLCRVKGTIRLRNGHARIRHSGFGPLEVSETGPVYGNLGGGLRVAALQVWCSNQGGTAAGQLAEGFVVFSGTGGRLHALGTLTARYHPRSAPHVPFITVRSIGAERVVTTEFFYGSADPDCCPSGRASTTWHWNGRSFKPGRTTIIRA